MNLQKCILVNNDCYKSGKTIKPKGIMVHSTGANNPRLSRYVQPNDGKLGDNKYDNDWNRSGVKKCVHAFIGKLENGSIATYQTLPWNFRGWHAGKGKSGKSANDTHIGFEICEDDLKSRTYFDGAYREAVELTAYLCKQYKLDPLADGVVICHCEGYDRGVASGHADVEHWFPKYGKNMMQFRKDVSKAIGNVVKEEPKKTFESYRIKVVIDDLNIRKGAGTNYKRVGYIKPGVYTIVGESTGKGASKWLKLKSGAGWISADFVKKL